MTLFMFACSLGQAVPTLPTTVTAAPSTSETMSPTLSPSPVPFQKYGETLRDVTYCTPDGLFQKMDVYFPEAGGPWPLLAYVHGGAWMHGDKSEALALARGMTSQGYLVVSINYRLYPAAKFPGMIEDVKCAIRFLRAHAHEYNLDPTRIAALGVSAGGHLVSLLGTADESAGFDVGEYLDQSSRVQAVIAMAPPTDLTRNFPNADMELLRHSQEIDLIQASPIMYVTADDPPFLLIHGTRDTVVPYEQSQLLVERLVQANVPAQLVTVQNADHSMSAVSGSATPTIAEINQTLLDFLATYLK